jgi:hypothetical protein
MIGIPPVKARFAVEKNYDTICEVEGGVCGNGIGLARWFWVVYGGLEGYESKWDD